MCKAWLCKNNKEIVALTSILSLIAIPVAIFLGLNALVAHPHIAAYTFRANNDLEGNYFFNPVYKSSQNRLVNVIGVTNDGQLPVIMNLPEYGYEISCHNKTVFSLPVGVVDHPSTPEGTVEGNVLKEGETRVYLLDINTKEHGLQIVEGCHLVIDFTTHNEVVSVKYDKEIKIFE